MSLSDKLLSQSINVLDNGCAGRARMESVGNGVPGNGHLVASALVMKMKQQLFCHARTCNDVSLATRCSKNEDNTYVPT